MTRIAEPINGENEDRAALRQELRAFLAERLPPLRNAAAFPRNFPPGDEHAGEAASSRAWHRALFEGGWIAPGWPVELGGRGFGLEERLVYAEEMAAARAPKPVGFNGVDILGPALIAHGTSEQHERFLPPILSGDELWCQGYSEPDAGSDLASLRTTAVPIDDGYVISGQKTWASYGNRADWCYVLARVDSDDGDPSRHRGITLFLIQMRQPGVEWRKTRQITGEKHFGDLFLDSVFVPSEQRLGAEGQGWAIAMGNLGFERLLAGSAIPLRGRIDALRSEIDERGVSPINRQRFVDLEIRVRVTTWLQSRVVQRFVDGDESAGMWASMIKLASTELRKEIASLAVDVVGPIAMATELAADAPGPGLWGWELLDSRAGSIYGGTSEIQRNILGERGLHLPR
jgi:alkylation response protein AidB-like acyl-CoA dehydrogenase